jgi:hypothetical protein
LSNEQIWARGSENENSIGNLVLHLCGNVQQWIVSGGGGESDVRDRDSEFAALGGVNARELQHRLETAVHMAAVVIRTLPASRLPEIITVQNYKKPSSKWFTQPWSTSRSIPAKSFSRPRC